MSRQTSFGYALGCSADLLPPSPPAKQATTRQDQTGTRPTRLPMP